ncbi:hypothetical protein LM13656_130210 [Listeria monocytogenes]|nr:hypothetical protein LM1000505_130208 [Listeria monocytogenes]CUK32474.1 hypothetical protein LM500008_130245 [Listeria monocytogenes]CUK32676.1 hypothetical protein LM13656_130210 [Listeria monocytogenes]CUK37739.1 hypothetical protein LM500172_120245 [Listeria monocytogenes]CUK43263.1 hypothetical protein LM500190_140245 [Listeria monocytogenes]
MLSLISCFTIEREIRVKRGEMNAARMETDTLQKNNAGVFNHWYGRLYY